MNVASDARRARAGGLMAAPILITDGDKGGVGKSFLARVLAYLLTNNGFGWVGVDLDARNGHLQRFHTKEDVARLDWTGEKGWNTAYERIRKAEPSQFVLVDLPSQAGAVLHREYPRLLFTANEVARPVFRFWSVSRGFDSVNLLWLTLDLVPCQNTFAVLDLREGAREDFDLWLKSGTRRALLDGGGLEFCMPRLSAGVAAEIDAADLPFTDASSRLEQPYFRYDIEAFLAQIKQEFAPLQERIA